VEGGDAQALSGGGLDKPLTGDSLYKAVDAMNLSWMDSCKTLVKCMYRELKHS